jgi:hypothetical protein
MQPSDSGGAVDFDKLTLELTADPHVGVAAMRVLESFSTSGLSHPQSSDSIDSSAWLFVRTEVHSLLCTKSAKYRAERELLAQSTKPAIAVFTGLLVSHFGISAGMAGSLAALALLVPFKLALNSWCAIIQESPRELSRREKISIMEIADAERTKTRK